jgi:tetratricopeptide (TPR) repeat protein
MKTLSTVLFLCFSVLGVEDQSLEALLKPAHGYGVFTYGMHAYASGDKKHALAAFELAAEEDATLGRAYFHKADVLFEKGKLSEAEESYLVSLKLESDFFFAYYNLACAASLKGEKSKALSCLEDAFRLGYNRFEKLLKDSDLANIRESPELVVLIERYRKQSPKGDIVAEFLLGTLEQKITIIQRIQETQDPNWKRIADKALLDSNYEVRIFGLGMYCRFGGDTKFRVLVRGLFDNNGYVNKSAANFLVEAGARSIPYIDVILASDYDGAKFYAKQIRGMVAPDRR